MVNKFLYPHGGPETYMLKLGKYLTSLGHRVEYFGMEHPDRCVENNANCYTENMDFHNSSIQKKLKLPFKIIYSNEARKKISAVIEDFKPDIVHLNNINFQLTPSIIYEIKKHGIPIVQTVHDPQIACPNHKMYIDKTHSTCEKCLNGNYINCVKNKCVHNSAARSMLAAFEAYLYHKKDAYNLVDCFICPSKFITDIMLKAGIRKEKLVTLHNFCNKHIDLPPKNLDKKYVLYFGRLSPEKGIKTLIEVCKELDYIHFIFAGEGELSDLCKGIDNAEYVGFKFGEELDRLIRNALFSVSPSEWYENCSMSIMESLSLGTPAIGSDLGGIPELIKNNETGLIFKAKDKNALKEAIEALYNNPEKLNEMSRKCLEISNENNIENYTIKLTAIYNSLINKASLKNFE